VQEPTLSWDLSHLPKRIERLLWHPPLEQTPWWKAALLRLARIAAVIARDVQFGD